MLRNARIAVVSTSLVETDNDLWEACRAHVGELVLIGSRQSMSNASLRAGTVGLRELDFGRGLIWRHLRRLRRTLADFGPDLLHVNGELWGLTAQEALSLPAPVVIHGAENIWRHGNRVESTARDLLVKRALKRIAGYASWNVGGANHVKAIASPSLPILAIPAIIPPRPFRERLWIGAESQEDYYTILLVGRLVPMKGFDSVIRAVSLLSFKERIRVVLCGDGPQELELRSSPRKLESTLSLEAMYCLNRSPL